MGSSFPSKILGSIHIGSGAELEELGKDRGKDSRQPDQRDGECASEETVLALVLVSQATSITEKAE